MRGDVRELAIYIVSYHVDNMGGAGVSGDSGAYIPLQWAGSRELTTEDWESAMVATALLCASHAVGFMRCAWE
jgi:hypothetical protein